VSRSNNDPSRSTYVWTRRSVTYTDLSVGWGSLSYESPSHFSSTVAVCITRYVVATQGRGWGVHLPAGLCGYEGAEGPAESPMASSPGSSRGHFPSLRVVSIKEFEPSLGGAWPLCSRSTLKLCSARRPIIPVAFCCSLPVWPLALWRVLPTLIPLKPTAPSAGLTCLSLHLRFLMISTISPPSAIGIWLMRGAFIAQPSSRCCLPQQAHGLVRLASSPLISPTTLARPPCPSSM